MSKQSKKQFDQLLNLLHELNIQRVDSDFVEDLWRGEIDEDNITAPKITEETLTDVLTEITSNKYLPKEAATPSSVGRLWTLMTEREMPPRNLVALLYQIIRSSKNSDLSFLAAHIYIAMLQLPGSNVYNVFNPFVFRTVLNLVREWTVRGNSKKRKQKNFFDEEIEEPKEEMEVEDEEDDKKQDQSVNIQRVIGLLETMKRLFVTYAMDNHQESVINAVEVLSEATRYTYDDGTVKKKRARTVEHPESVVKMWDHCYSVLKSLLHSMHGATEHNLGIVFKHLLGNVLLTFDAVNGASVPKTYHAIRTKALGFIKRVVESEPEDKQVSSALQVLLQYVCMRAPEKAEYRHLAAKSINELFDLLHNEDKTRFIRFVDKYSKNKKTNYRMFAVETALEMINDKAREESLNESQQGDLSSLLNIIMARSCDKLVGIRSKALSAITSMLDAFETYGPFKQLLMATFTASQVTNTLLNTPGSVSFATPPNSNSPKTPTAATPSTPNTTAQSPATPVTPSTPGQSVSLWTLLARRAQDPKCAVRRSAVTALAALGAVTVPPAGPTASLLAQRAADPSRAVRRAALGALGSFAAREGGAWSRAWVVAAWPRACDTEASVAAQVLNDFTAIVIDRVISNYQDDTLWQLIEDADQPSSDMGKYMQKICALLAKEKKLPRKLVTNLEHAITKTSRRGPWILLAYVAPFCAEQITHKLVADRWNKLKSTDKGIIAVLSLMKRLTDANLDEFDDDKVKVLRILSYIVGSIDSSLGEALFDDLLRRLEKFNHKPILIQNYIQTLSKLSQRQQSNAKNAKVTYPWAKKLLETCDEALARIVLPAAGANAQSSQSQSKSAVSSFEALERYLFTVGELAQLCPESISKRLVAVIQTLISPSLNLFDSPVPHSLTAHAFVSLGKLCLNDPALAKQCVAVFAKELHTSPHPTVRNNVMVIMCDLCIRYPSLVDNYIPSLTLCLRDENELVRRQTLVMLTQLIQEDFIKWKSGSLLFRFVLSLVDDSQNVRDYARVCLETLITKNSNVSHMFYLQFIETIFCLNDYRLHTTYNQYPQSEKERILFSLKGSGDNKDKRMSIYTMFLEHMSDDEKFNLTSKLCLEVLGGVVEGKMALQQAQHVLSDALSILTSKEIKLGATTTKDEDIDEDENPEAQKLADAKGKILSKLVKKNVMENIVPIVLELKQLLETNRSPLLGNLIEYLKDLMKEYKDEVEEILVDKKLIKELEYELRQFKPQTVTAFKSPAPPSATKQVPMASPRPVISASPKGRPSLANFAVPKLRKRVSLALASYTPSPARKNVSDVRRALLDEEKPEGVEKDVETENKSEEPVFRMPTTPFRGGAQSADLRMPPLPSPGRRDWPTLRRPRNTSSPTKEDSRPQSEEVPEEPKIAVKRQGTKRKAPEAPSSPQAPVSPVRKRAARGSASSESTANSRKRKRETTVKETTGTKKNTRKKAEDSDEEISDLSSDDDVAANDKAASDDEISDVSSDEEEKENKSNVNKTTKARGAAAKAKSKAPVKTTTRAAPARRTTRKVRDD